MCTTKRPSKQSTIHDVMPCFSSMWIKVGENIPVNSSCLVLRRGSKLCNLYFDGKNWMDDGYDSKQERVFTDVTHYIELKNIPLPK